MGLSQPSFHLLTHIISFNDQYIFNLCALYFYICIDVIWSSSYEIIYTLLIYFNQDRFLKYIIIIVKVAFRYKRLDEF